MSKKKKPSPKKTSKRAGKKKPWFTYKDLIILFTTKGIAAVKEMFEKGTVKPAMLRKAATALSHKELTAFSAEHAAPGVRGRSSPTTGDDREYKAQQVAMPSGKMSTLFVRLPVETVVKKKGQPLKVSFEKNKIVLTAA